MRIVKQNRFKNLGELHMEWTEAGVKASRATTHRRVNEFVYSCCQRRLTWAKEKNWTVGQWSIVLFSDESKFCISFVNQCPRVWRKGGEAHSPSYLKSSVKFPQSVMIWGAMSSAGVGPLCFLKTNITAPIYQDILEHFMLPSTTWSWLNDHGVGVLDWPANSPDLNPIESLCMSRGKWETRDQKMQMSWRPRSKKPGLPYHLSSVTNWSPLCHAELRQ